MSTMKMAADPMMAAVERVGRKAVIALLERFGARKVSELKLGDVDAFVRRCNALQPPPPVLPPPPTPVSMNPLFALGDKVQSTPGGFTGTVDGYELRYIVNQKHMPPLPFRGEDLRPQPPVEAPPPAPVAESPVDFSPLYAEFERAERLLPAGKARDILRRNSGVAIPSHVKAQDVNNCIIWLRHHADAAAGNGQF